MIKCQHCQAEMDNGAMFCDFCGHELSSEREPSGGNQPPRQTAQPAFPNPANASAPLAPAPQPSAVPESQRIPSVIVLRLATGQQFTLRGKTDYTVGRVGAGRKPLDVDLAQWYGYEAGVSREHISIHVQPEGVFIEDLYSRNETIHNNYRLMPGQLYPLRDGDEVHLGAIVLYVEFQYA